MTTMANGLPAEALLAHADFVRSVAWHLLRDDADADDAAQEAMVKALGRGPAQPEHTRTWLYAVVQSVARKMRRDTGRRDRRERRAARPESTTDPAGLALRAETIRTVADAVASLGEPYRLVVLLRHYDGLPPREISARLGVPVETVKSQLKRAHDRLRQRLDLSESAGKGRWRVALAGFTGISDGGPIASVTAAPLHGVAGGIAMGATVKVAAAAAGVLLLAGLAYIALRPTTPATSTSVAAARPAIAGASEVPATSGLEAHPLASTPPTPPAVTSRGAGELPPGWVRKSIGRVSLAVPPDWKEQQGREPGSATWALLDSSEKLLAAFGIVPKEAGPMFEEKAEVASMKAIVVGGAPATWKEMRPQNERAAALVVPNPSWPGEVGVLFVAMAQEAVWPEQRAAIERILASVAFLGEAPTVPFGSADEPASIALVDSLERSIPGTGVEGTVLLGSSPLGGVAIHLELDAPGIGPDSPTTRHTTTDASGSFRFEEVGGGAYGLDVRAPGRTQAWVRLPVGPAGPSRARVVVQLGSGRISGRVFDRLGKPAVGVMVQARATARLQDRWACHRTEVAGDGTYDLTSLPAGDWDLEAYLTPSSSPHPDVRDLHMTLGWGEHKVVDSGSAKPEPRLVGQVRTSNGMPIPGPAVWLLLAGTSQRSAGMLLTLDAEGKFDRRLPRGPYRATVEGSLAGSAPVTFELTLSDTDVTRDVIVPGAGVQGVVWDAATDKPVERGWRRAVTLERASGGAPISVWIDVDGTFGFYGVAAGTYRLRANLGPDSTDGRSEPLLVEVRDGRDATGIRLEVPRR